MIAELLRDAWAPRRGSSSFAGRREFLAMERESPDCAKSLIGQFEQPRAEECVARLARLVVDTPCPDRALYETIKVPTLVLGNRQDPIHPWDAGRDAGGADSGCRVLRDHAEIGEPRAACGRCADGLIDRRFLGTHADVLRVSEGRPMLKCSASLWSADLVEPGGRDPAGRAVYGAVSPGCRRRALCAEHAVFSGPGEGPAEAHGKPFEVHLMTTDPLAWVEPFVEAGADGVIFCFDSLKDPAAAIKKVKDLGKFVAISLLVTEPVSLLEPYWNLIDQVTIVGTPMGTKGTSMEPSIFDKIREARAAIEKHGRG